MGVLEHVPCTIILPRLSFFVWKPGPNKHGGCAEPCSRIYSCMLMHCKHLRGRTSGVKQEEEKHVCICHYRFDLSPRAGPFVIQTKEASRRFFAALHDAPLGSKKKEGDSRLLSKVPCYLGRSHVSHWKQFTSTETYFRKPLIRTRDKRVSFFLSILKWSAASGIPRFFFLFQSGTSAVFKKGVLKVILHFILTNSPRHVGWCRTGNERRHVRLTEQVGFTYISPTRSVPACF